MKTMSELELELDKIIGNRLKQVRETYGDKIGNGRNYTQGQMAEIAGLTQNSIHRLEQDLNGTSKNLMKLLRIYEQAGFNLSWIFTLKNKNIPFTINIHESDSFMEPASKSEILDISYNKYKFSQEAKEKILRDVDKVLEKYL